MFMQRVRSRIEIAAVVPLVFTKRSSRTRMRYLLYGEINVYGGNRLPGNPAICSFPPPPPPTPRVRTPFKLVHRNVKRRKPAGLISAARSRDDQDPSILIGIFKLDSAMCPGSAGRATYRDRRSPDCRNYGGSMLRGASTEGEREPRPAAKRNNG